VCGPDWIFLWVYSGGTTGWRAAHLRRESRGNWFHWKQRGPGPRVKISEEDPRAARAQTPVFPLEPLQPPKL